MKTLSNCIVLAGGLWIAALPAGYAQPIPAGNCVLSPPGLVGWWRGESNALDSIGPNNGTLFNNVGFAPAKVGTGFAFRGGTDYVGLPQNLFPVPTAGTGTTPFSFEVWFSTTAGGVLLGQQDQMPFGTALGGYVPALYVGTNGKLYAALFWDNFKQLVSGSAVNNGAFHHAAITYDGTNEVLYLDGTAIASTNFTQRAYASSYQYQLGTGYGTPAWPATLDGWYPFNGLVDEASLYNRALTASEVAAIFNAGSAGKCTGTPPQILTQPADQVVALGANATFAVVATGTAPLRYQWQFNGRDLAESTHYVGATSNILTIVDVAPFDAGSYRVVITNDFGVTNSAVVNLAAFPSCLAPPQGLVGWWRGENNALDSADAHPGTLMNSVGFAMGEVGCGFAFRGGTDYVALPQNLFPFPTSGTSTTPFSFEVWFSTSAGGVILGQQDQIPFGSALAGFVPALYVGTDGKLHAALFWDNFKELASSTAVNDGAFHHAAITYNGTDEVLYLDGTAIGSTNFLQRAYAGSYQYQLGTGYTGGRPAAPGGWFSFNGIVDEASLYNRALTAGEVAAIFLAGHAGKCISGPGPVLRHRYSFNESAGSKTAFDSAGRANGTLLFASPAAPYTNGPSDGSAFTGNGQLKLNGTNGYVDLPDGIVSSLANVSFEAWVTWQDPDTTPWQRLFDFGANDRGLNASGTGTNYLMLSPRLGGFDVLGFEESTVNPLGPVMDPKALVLGGATPLPLNQATYVAVTYDPVAGMSQLFVNGQLVNSFSGPLNALSQFVDYNNYLGRSQWEDDPFFKGQWDEFRIWEGILSFQQITNHFAAGPDQPLPGMRPYLTIVCAGANVVLAWTTNSTENFKLVSADTMPPTNWTAVVSPVVVNGAFYQVTVPATSSATFYRLRQ